MMTARLSSYLDLIRFLAAIIVLLSHFAYERFSNGTYLFIRELNLGSDAVVVFFVLSGFVIAFVTDTKDKDARTYFFNRGTRLLSVAIPALMLTFLMDRVGSTIAPQLYSGWWYNPLSPIEFFIKGITFSNEWTAWPTRLGTNGPYWSISYEAAYYVLFGVFCFTTGVKRIGLITLGLIIFGLNILLLAPSWILGAWVYKLTQNKSQNTTSKLVPWCVCLSPIFLYVLFLNIELPNQLSGMTNALLGDYYKTLRFSNEFIWNALIGILFAAHIYGAKIIMEKSTTPMILAGKIKWLAGATFSIYLIHYPALQLFKGVLPNFNNNAVNDILLLASTLITCFIFAHFFERKLYSFRKWCLEIANSLKFQSQSI